MNICRALLKHGYSNFSFEILEYCEVSELLKREKHYFDLLSPEYNISTEPTASMLGRKHSEETLKKMLDAQKGENHYMFGKKHSEETINKISDAMLISRAEKSGKPIEQ
jgi:group I intron endonuclease